MKMAMMMIVVMVSDIWVFFLKVFDEEELQLDFQLCSLMIPFDGCMMMFVIVKMT